MTSNVGSYDLLDGVKDGAIPESTRDAVLAQLRAFFKPEFLNRLHDIVLFKPLIRNEIREIIALLMKDLSNRIEERALRLKLHNYAIDFIAERGYDPALGARPLKRYVQRDVETPIARTLIDHAPEDGATVLVTRKD